MSKWPKAAFLATLLILAGYFFGMICVQLGQAYKLMIPPSGRILNLLLWFLLALITVMISAGLVAALLRPVWVGVVAFAFSGLAMLLGWKVTVFNGTLALVYLVAGAIYAVGAARELNQQVRFSLQAISRNQHILRIALVLVACGSMYPGYAAYIEQEGFSIPETYVEMLMAQQERQVVSRVPPERRQEAVALFRAEFRRSLDELFERWVKPHERFIPLAVVACLFMTLTATTRLVVWVPTMALGFLIRILTALGVTKVVTETREVQRLIIP